MAKDRISIFIPNLPETLLLESGTPWVSHNRKGRWSKYHKGKMEEKYHRRVPRYLHGSMTSTSGYIHVDFLKYSPEWGDLIISFSVSDLYFGSNAIPKSVVDINELVSLILSELHFILDVKHLPTWETWRVCRDETNVDIIESRENLKRRMEIMSRSTIPYRKVDSSLKSEGSVYFRGRAGKRSSGQLIVYDKLKEQAEKGIDMSKLLGLREHQGCLRIEIKTRKSPLQRHVTLTRKLSRNQEESRDRDLRLVMSGAFQVNVLMEAITKLHLDKIITTRLRLIKVLKGSGLFTNRQLKTVLQVIRHENGERYSHKLNQRTIDKYKNLILSTGFHYLYSDIELKPVSRDMVEAAVSLDLCQIRI